MKPTVPPKTPLRDVAQMLVTELQLPAAPGSYASSALSSGSTKPSTRSSPDGLGQARVRPALKEGGCDGTH